MEVQISEDYKQFDTKGFFSRHNLLSEHYDLNPGKRTDIMIFKNDLFLALVEKNILHGDVRLFSYFKDETDRINKSNNYDFDLDGYEECL
ncbi:MAG TPA: hypothetical protein PKV33_04540 [Methanothrix sp.]|nr:hypothetical protein [Methanothrix sp.]